LSTAIAITTASPRSPVDRIASPMPSLPSSTLPKPPTSSTRWTRRLHHRSPDQLPPPAPPSANSIGQCSTFITNSVCQCSSFITNSICQCSSSAHLIQVLLIIVAVSSRSFTSSTPHRQIRQPSSPSSLPSSCFDSFDANLISIKPCRRQVLIIASGSYHHATVITTSSSPPPLAIRASSPLRSLLWCRPLIVVIASLHRRCLWSRLSSPPSSPLPLPCAAVRCYLTVAVRCLAEPWLSSRGGDSLTGLSEPILVGLTCKLIRRLDPFTLSQSQTRFDPTEPHRVRTNMLSQLTKSTQSESTHWASPVQLAESAIESRLS